MPQFKILEVRECDPATWLAFWAAKYDGSSGFDEEEYRRLITLAKQESFPAKFFERIGRWKDSANTDRRWQPNVASVAYIIWRQAEAEQPGCPTNEKALDFLNDWASRAYEDVYRANPPRTKRFGLSRATTLLHFLSGGSFPIFDSNVRTAICRLYGVSPKETATYYLSDFCPLFLELAANCRTDDLRRLDKALFSCGLTTLLG
jgi:hypothetical protein